MRHLWSLLAGIVAAPLVWLLLATGQHRAHATVAGWERAGQFDTADLVGPVVYLTVAGLLLGVLGTLRWSPTGPVAAGLLLVAPTVAMFGNPSRTLDVFSYGTQRRVFGQDLQPWLPVENGTLLVLGALLLVAVASRQRWRRWPQPASGAGATGGGAGAPAGAAAPDAGQPPDAAPQAAPAGTPPGTTPQPQSPWAPPAEEPSATPMSDDEILAAAAAIDEQLHHQSAPEQQEPSESAETSEPQTPSGQPEPPGQQDSSPPASGQSTPPPDPGTDHGERGT